MFRTTLLLTCLSLPALGQTAAQVCAKELKGRRLPQCLDFRGGPDHRAHGVPARENGLHHVTAEKARCSGNKYSHALASAGFNASTNLFTSSTSAVEIGISLPLDIAS